MKYFVIFLFLFVLAPTFNAALAGDCGSSGNIHTDEKKKEKKSES